MAVLTLNAGSSSLKFAVFDGTHALLRGAFESLDERPKAKATGLDGAAIEPPKTNSGGHDDVLPVLFEWVEQHLNGARLEAVGHRIVHGGERSAPAIVDEALLTELEALTPLAPLHQPHNIAGIRAAQKAQPGLRQVACFDTAFHQTLPQVARQLALPERLGLRRYGFHGLSYAWIVSQLPPHLVTGRVVVAHLGSGASLCALQAGRSVETTMSTTPLDGLVMSTRCGSLDPGVVLHLVRSLGVDAAEHLLYHEAGLLGVSGTSGDVRELGSTGPAVELFAYRAAMDMAWMAAATAGLDGVVFTGGIGEHDAAVRAAICDRLAWLGVAIDPAATTGRISTQDSKVEVWVIATDEEAVIASQAAALCEGGAASVLAT